MRLKQLGKPQRQCLSVIVLSTAIITASSANLVDNSKNAVDGNSNRMTFLQLHCPSVTIP
ncbi:MAG: hypothetical protein J6568_07200 [Snodgrassella sp.]|nr:hypothetical protein [Snodgrassella sp.]